MENASKALIMAGGLLIALMIASIMVYLYADYGRSAKEINDRIHERQESQERNEYTKYTGSLENTMYDVITVVNKARNDNANKDIEGDTGHRAYITVRITNYTDSSGIAKVRLEQRSTEELNKLLETYLSLPNPPFFECDIKEEDGLISEIIFKAI